MSNYNEIKADPIDNNKKFITDKKILDFSVNDFWKWALSDLIENRNRGILAEFLVMQALGVKQDTRLEWDAFDIITEDDIKVEVKSSAYYQSWKQKKKSSINFGIAPTRALLDDNNYSKEKKRHSDVYIFCVFDIQSENAKLDPMNLNQWSFYLMETKTLNNLSLIQKSIALSSLKKLEHIQCSYDDLKSEFSKIITISS